MFGCKARRKRLALKRRIERRKALRIEKERSTPLYDWGPTEQSLKGAIVPKESNLDHFK